LPARPWIDTGAELGLPVGASFGDGYASAEAVRFTAPPHEATLEDGRTVAVYYEGEPRPETVPRELRAEKSNDDGIPDFSSVALRVRGLRKQFGSNAVLNDVSLEVKPREILGILGE